MKAHATVRTTIFAVIGLAMPALQSCTDMGTWDLLSREESAPVFSASMEITIDAGAVGEFMYDVPALVRLTPANFDYDLSVLDGSDIGFYAEPYQVGADSLDHAVGSWNPDGTSFFWVRIPLVTPASTISIYLHVGSPDSIPENPAGVWRNGYAAVYQFDDSGARFNDTTQFENHGVAGVAPMTAPAIVTGVIGDGVSTAANSTDGILIPNSSSMQSLAPFTFSAWIQVPDDLGSGRLFDKSQRFLNVKGTSGPNQYQAKIKTDATDMTRDLNDDAALFDTWVNVTLRWNGAVNSSQMQLLIDGVSATSVTTTSATGTLRDDGSSSLALGNNAGGFGGSNFKGEFDQVEISFVRRSDDWIAFHVATVNQTNMSYGSLDVR